MVLFSNQKFKCLIALLMAILIFSANVVAWGSPALAASDFAGGTGTESDPYLISTKWHLNNVRKYLNAHFKMIADVEFADADFKKGGKFYNGGKGWSPIGTNDESAFTGTFDGNEHTVKNLYIMISKSSSKSEIFAGLFGYNKGTIINLGVVDGVVWADSTSGSVYVGGIVGKNHGVIENCYNTGDVVAGTSANNFSAAGGIVGANLHVIFNCYNTGNVSSLIAISDFVAYAGGIAGFCGGRMIECYNKGKVEATSFSDVGNAWAGGITGCKSSRDIINCCYNMGEVLAIAESKGEAAAGGIVANNTDSTIEICYNTGTVSATSESYAIAGGIVGDIGADYGSFIDEGTIENCYNTGAVSASTSAFTGNEGNSYAGGIAGYIEESTIENCYNTGTVSALSYAYSHAIAGGIGGYNEGKMIDCYNIGTVSARIDGYDAYTLAGGIAGYNGRSIITCYYLDTMPNGTGDGDDPSMKCTAEQMKSQSSYFGFDFNDVWTMKWKNCYPYPALSAVELLTHDYDNVCDATCDCGYVRTPPHNYGKYVYNNDATAKKDGTKTGTCLICGATETITATGTKWPNPFRDVKSKEFYYTPVLWAVREGITSGTSKTTFSPNDDCTRGQIATFLWRAAGQPTPKTSKNPFSDVKKSDYYYKAVLWAVGKGITSGTSKTTFSPNAPCTRGQIAAFLWRANGTPKPKTSKNPFTDVKKSDFYYKAVLWAVENGITSGTTKTTFGPSETCTRGQIATFLYRNYN